MTAPHQHAAIAGHEREHVAGAHHGVRAGILGDGRADGGDAVGGAHAGGHALARLDRHGEGGAVLAPVVLHHRPQPEFADLGLGQAQADDAAAFADHHRHIGRGQALGGEDQVRLVLAVVVIEQHDGTALTHGLERVRDALGQRARIGIGHGEAGGGIDVGIGVREIDFVVVQH
ncbi:hypothetical protein D3C72_1508020 [compost metagenome]